MCIKLLIFVFWDGTSYLNMGLDSCLAGFLLFLHVGIYKL